MKQKIDSRVAIGLITVIALIAVGLLWRSLSGASAPANSAAAIVHPTGGGSRARAEEMRSGHMDR